MAPYFSKAGINIHQITTLESYLTARRQAAPYFLEWLTDKVSDLPLSDESSLLMQLISLDTDTFDKALSDHLAS